MDFERKLIEEVKYHPCLYDMKHPDYNNKTVTEKVWEEIQNNNWLINAKRDDVMSHIDVGIRDDEYFKYIPPNKEPTCKKTWARLLGRFWGELQAADDSEYAKRGPWVFMHEMLFFKPFVATMRGSSTSPNDACFKIITDYIDKIDKDKQEDFRFNLVNFVSKEFEKCKNK